MFALASRILSLLIAGTYVVLIAHEQGGFDFEAFRLSAILLFPLALIWFPEPLGSLTGYVGRGGHIDTETPPWLVSLMGWFFLVGLPLFLKLAE